MVYNTLVEHYLHVWSALDNDVAKVQYEQKIVRLLQSSEACYDKDQILILCHQHNFRRGLLFLYEESKLYVHNLAVGDLLFRSSVLQVILSVGIKKYYDSTYGKETASTY